MNHEWHYDHQHGVYYHPQSTAYAIPDPLTGQWSYVTARDFKPGESSSRPLQPYEREEGEVEDDVGWGGLMEPDKLSAAVNTRQDRHPAYGPQSPQPVQEETPPHLLRLVAETSEVLDKGGVAVIDARDGGVQLGRDRCERGGTARVRLKEMPVSKTHALLYWGQGESGDEGWWAVDLGSTHGTFITHREQKRRLSEPKHASKPSKLEHLDLLIIGGTTFTAHIHPEWPCDGCKLNRDNEIRLDDGTQVPAEPTPPPAYAMDSKERRENREVRRQREMASLRETLLRGSGPAESDVSTPERTYIDRSAMRRKMQGKSPPRAAARRSVSPPRSTDHTPTPPSAFAANIMASQGWTPGSGLGKKADGRAQPVNVEMRTEKRGLGAAGSKAVVDEGPGDWRQRGKQRRYQDYNT